MSIEHAHSHVEDDGLKLAIAESVSTRELEMNNARRVTVSLAIFVLICFFLPWVQLSCVGVKDSVSGLSLARDGDNLLWLIPLFMLAVMGFGMARRIWNELPSVFALTSTLGGSFSVYLMYQERENLTRGPRLVATQWTIFFWLALAACLAIVFASIVFYSIRSRSP